MKISVFGFEGTNVYQMAQWLSWLERRPVTAEVTGSNPVWVVWDRNFLSLLCFRITVRGSGPQWRNWQTPGT